MTRRMFRLYSDERLRLIGKQRDVGLTDYEAAVLAYIEQERDRYAERFSWTTAKGFERIMKSSGTVRDKKT